MFSARGLRLLPLMVNRTHKVMRLDFPTTRLCEMSYIQMENHQTDGRIDPGEHTYI